MWTVIYIAPSQQIAEQMERKLTEEGFLVKIRPARLSKKQYELLVPESELDDVQEILNSILYRK